MFVLKSRLRWKNSENPCVDEPFLFATSQSHLAVKNKTCLDICIRVNEKIHSETQEDRIDCLSFQGLLKQKHLQCAFGLLTGIVWFSVFANNDVCFKL